jgi:hypothetical protein
MWIKVKNPKAPAATRILEGVPHMSHCGAVMLQSTMFTRFDLARFSRSREHEKVRSSHQLGPDFRP